jgi:hypothetical protein
MVQGTRNSVVLLCDLKVGCFDETVFPFCQTFPSIWSQHSDIQFLSANPQNLISRQTKSWDSCYEYLVLFGIFCISTNANKLKSCQYLVIFCRIDYDLCEFFDFDFDFDFRPVFQNDRYLPSQYLVEKGKSYFGDIFDASKGNVECR